MEAKIATRGVEYYNKEKQRRIKDNLLVEETSTKTHKNDFVPSSSGSEAEASVSHGNAARPQVVPEIPVLAAPEEDFVLSEQHVKRAPIQLWDNGEKEFRRYKLKIRLNLTDGQNPEFIASLTKDIRNFKKYIPEECKDKIIEQAKKIRTSIKDQYGVFPYMGKFHLANGFRKGRRNTNQVEPWTFAAVWWDAEEKGWSGMLCIHDFAIEFDLFEDNLTVKQKAAGCKAATLYINPLHDERIRPKTWLQIRKEQAQKS